MHDETAIAVAPGSFSRREERELPAIVSAGNATSLLQAIERAASNPQTDIEKMERLFAMHQKMVAQEAEAAFNGAMARAQAKIGPVAHNASNTQTSSRYAKLAAINKAITPIYTAEGLSISFDTAACPIKEYLRVVAIVSHAQGHSRQYHLDLPLDNVGIKESVNKTKVHATGSTNSYGRRYLALMIFNVSTEDDTDGNQPRTAGMPDEEFQALAKSIKSATTKDKAKAAWKEAVKAAEGYKDLDAANKLKEVLIEQGKFIDGTVTA